MNIFRILSFTILICLSQKDLNAQEQIDANLDFLRAFRFESDQNNNLYVLFLITPSNLDNFPPVLQTEFTYFIGNSKKANHITPKTQFASDKGIELQIFDKNIERKNKLIFTNIKDIVNFEAHEKLLILVFKFVNLIPKKTKKMHMLYGLGKKAMPENTEKFSFKVDAL